MPLASKRVVRVGIGLCVCVASAICVAGQERRLEGMSPRVPGPRPGELTPPDSWQRADTGKPKVRRPAEGPSAPTIYLHASVAKCHGRGLRYEKVHRRDNIGFWNDPRGYVTWDFDVPIPDTFTVLVTVACPPGTAGSDYAVVVERRAPLPDALEGTRLGKYIDKKLRQLPLDTAKQELAGVVPNTGDWGNFVTEELGTMTFDVPGKYTVAVKCTRQARGAVMNLQAVTFRSARWDNTLVAWWRFAEGSGSETQDGASGSRDVVQFARWVRGAQATGLKFNGCSSSVRRAAAQVPPLRDAMTIEAWVRLDSEQDAWCPIVNHLRYPQGFFFGLDGGGDLGLHMAVGGKWLACTSSARLPVGEWAHVAATFEKDRGLSVYVDGQETGRLVALGTMAPAKTTDLLIGRHNNHPWVFHGVIDEVKLYNRALGPLEVQQHYEWGKALLKPPPLIVLRAVRPDRTRARVFERVILDVDLDATFDNAFDAGDVRVDAEVIAPSGKVWRVPGFYYQAYSRRLEKNVEKLVPDGEPRWQVRLSFAEPGQHWVQVAATDRTGTMMAAPVTIDVEAADAAGMIRRHPDDHRYFVTDRGESFFPIGANVCWADARATYAYDEWLAAYAKHGGNFFRVWLSPQWPTLALNTIESGFDAIDLARAWRLDHVLEAAERLDLRVMLCIDSFNILRTKALSPGNWEDAPYIRSQGGPLDQPHEYFTNRWSLAAYRNRLRYLVARWGYSPSVFAWEFWNEVDGMDSYDPHAQTIRAWHAQMAGTLRTLDPWDHLITTSYARTHGDSSVERLPELDFVMSHSYGAQDMALELGRHIREKTAALDRPHFHGELGIFGSGQQTSDADPTGIHLHNALFACVGQGHAGTPMTWWWDSYVHPRKLYPMYRAFAGWIEGFDFVAQEARPAEVEVLEEDLRVIGPTDLELVRGTWEPAPFNRPIAVRVDRDGVLTHSLPISDLLHGVGFHKNLHNPVTFELDVPRATTFAVHVAKTSGFGDGILRIYLDGRLSLESKFPVPKGNKKDTLALYKGSYPMQLPAGRHTVVVANAGKDWVGVEAYHIPWLRASKRAAAPLRIIGVVGNTRALIWAQNKSYTWLAATKKGFVAQPIVGARLRIAGLARGRWIVEHWDTHGGAVTKAEVGTVGADGALVVSLPDVVWDAALRLRRAAKGEQPPRIVIEDDGEDWDE